MSDTTKRGELLVAVKNLMRAGLHENAQEWAEFYTIIDPLFAELSAVDQLRERLAAVEAERDGYMHTCTEWVQAQLKWNEEFCGVRVRAERAERIVSALREPSEAVLAVICAEMGAISDHYLPTPATTLIRAAVAAAEQEVGG